MTLSLWKYPTEVVDPSPIVEAEGPLKCIIVREVQYERGRTSYPHRHRYGQIIHATSGLMMFKVSGRTWMVPHNRAVWVPPMFEHSVDMLTDMDMQNVFLKPVHCHGLPENCTVFKVTSAFREFTKFVAKIETPQEQKLATSIAVVMAQLIQDTITKPLDVPFPSHKGLQKLFFSLSNTPDNQQTIDEWGKMIGMTGRTLSRKLMDETGMTFSLWRQQIRLFVSLDRLAQGQPVTSVALDVGYNTPSAFITAFKKNFGMTPKDYIKMQDH